MKSEELRMGSYNDDIRMAASEALPWDGDERGGAAADIQ